MDTEENSELTYVYGDEVIVTGSTVSLTVAGTSVEDLSDQLTQLNQNVSDGCALIAGLFGVVLGFLAAKELLRIWLQ